MKKISIGLLLMALFCGTIAGKNRPEVERSAEQTTVRERVYLQTDKQLYMAGELLWLKLYTTDADGQLVDWSKVGYVELVSGSAAEKQVKIAISGGTGAGWMELSPMLPTGNYRLIAYTRLMRNEGHKVFFEKTVGVINPYIRNEHAFTTQAEKDASSIPAADPVPTTDNGLLSTDRPTYTKRVRGEIRLKGLPAENFHLAVSIAGADPIPSGAPALNGWKAALPALRNTALTADLLPEYEGPILEGKLINMETNRAENEVTTSVYVSFPGKELQLFPGRVDANGDITFVTSRLSGKKEVATAAFNTSDKKYRVDLNTPFVTHPEKHLPSLPIDSGWQNYIKRRHLGVEVTESYTADSLSRIEPIPPLSYYKPYRSFLLDEYTRFAHMEEVFTEFIPFVRIRREGEGRIFNAMTEKLDGYTTGHSLVLLDNIPVTNTELMAAYNPLLIKKIDVYLGKYTWGNQSFDGVLAFYSYNNDYPSFTFEGDTQLFDFEGTQAYRYFYSPVYGISSISRLPDFRHTLLWEPMIQTQKEQEIVIPFYTSDLTGTFQVTVEGISPEGQTISEQCTIEVTPHF